MLLLYSPFFIVAHYLFEPADSIAEIMLTASVLTASTGALFITSAILYWRGRWCYALIAFALAVSVYLL